MQAHIGEYPIVYIHRGAAAKMNDSLRIESIFLGENCLCPLNMIGFIVP